MKFKYIKTEIVLLAVVALLFAAFAMLATAAESPQLVAPKRITTYTWQCQDAAGAKISDHQDPNIAYVSCYNSPTGRYIQGGRYEMPGRQTAPEPTPTPTPTPTPQPQPTPVPSGSALLSWTPPAQKMDGSAITDLAGYRIMYGPSPTEMSKIIQLANPGLSSYIVTGLLPGTWHFAVVAYLGDGMSSDPSNVVSKTVR